MMKTTNRRINLVIGLLALFVAVFVVSSVTWGTTIYVDDDNIAGPWDGTIQHPYQHIQDGVNHSSPGDTVFVFNGFYNENVQVNKSISLTGQNRDSTIIDGGGSGDVISVSVATAEISGFTVQNSGSDYENAGIHGSGYVHDNLVRNNLRGIRTHSYSKLVGNYVASNVYTGIRVEDGSSNDSIYGNNVCNNGGAGIVLEFSCNNNTISGNIIAYNAMRGIICEALANGNLISQNTITNNETGVYLEVAHHNVMSENIIMGNTVYGMDVESGADNTISENIITNTGFGIFLCSDNNIILGNTITDCGSGIYVLSGDYNVITNNNIRHNENGIVLDIASKDTIVGNTITSNTSWGVYFWSSGNVSYHNNFTNNAQNAWDRAVNIWDNGYPSGGNYWSDYTGVDADSDGIGDIPYNIPGRDNQDRYPLVYIRGDANRNMIIDIADVLFLINFVYKNGPAPNLLPSGDANSDGVIDILDVYYLINYLFVSGPAPCEEYQNIYHLK